MVKKKRNFTQDFHCYQLILHYHSQALGQSILKTYVYADFSDIYISLLRNNPQNSLVKHAVYKVWCQISILISVSPFPHWRMEMITEPIYNSYSC